MNSFEYPVLLKADEDGGFVVNCRDLPELITQGEDEADALAEAADAMDEAFAARIDDGLLFPVPSKLRKGEYLVSPPAESIAKAALYTAMQEAKVTNVDLARRLGVAEKEVRRMLDPHHPSKLPRMAEAIKALGMRLVIGLESG